MNIRLAYIKPILQSVYERGEERLEWSTAETVA